MRRFLFLLLFGTGLLAFPINPVFAVQEDVFEGDPILERNREATVRIHNGRSAGTGTFFLKRDDKYYILTNAHVAGAVGNRVSFQMWWKGYLSREIEGRVVWSVMRRNYYRDVAIIEVPASALQGYEPPVIPLAPEDYQPKFQRIYSFGCGAGSWLTNWEGHAIDLQSNAGEVIRFHPQPAGGRSGSAIFSHDGKYIVALIAWRSEGGLHSLDGNSENPNAYGIAMTFREVREALKGGQMTTALDEAPTPLELEAYQPFQNAVVPDDAPEVFKDNAVIQDGDINQGQTHDAENILGADQLKFYDHRATDRSPTMGGKVGEANGAQYTELEKSQTQELFPGAPRRQQQEPSPAPPEEGFPFDQPPEPKDLPRERPEDRPRLLPPRDNPPDPPKLPDPQPEPPQEPEEEQESLPGVNWTNWLWVGFVFLGVLGWIKRPLNWVNVRVNARLNREELRKLVCDDKPTTPSE